MERGVFIYLLAGVAAIMAAGCEKESKDNGLSGSTGPAEKDTVAHIPVERVIFRMNGEICSGGESDSLKLYEEGLRTFEIAGYEPGNADVPVVDSVNFYRDVYAFSYTGDSVYVLGGSYAAPKNHYVSAVGEGFRGWKGRALGELPPVQFYNYVNRSYDYASVETQDGVQRVRWRDIGKLRRYRIEIILRQEIPNRFTFHFYELENRVTLPDTIKVAPGETVQLQPHLQAPEEFGILQWAKGHAGKSYTPLNENTVRMHFEEGMGNPNLTEDGKRYTNSKIYLTLGGILSVAADWDPSKAVAKGGAICNTVPICVIAMPEGDPQVERLTRSFAFPGGSVASLAPTPFFCNSVVQIVPVKGGQ